MHAWCEVHKRQFCADLPPHSLRNWQHGVVSGHFLPSSFLVDVRSSILDGDNLGLYSSVLLRTFLLHMMAMFCCGEDHGPGTVDRQVEGGGDRGSQNEIHVKGYNVPFVSEHML